MKHMLIILFSIFQLNFLWSDMSPTDKIRGKIICQFAKEMNAKGLHVAGSGGAQKNGKITCIEVSLDNEMPMNINSARMQIVEATRILRELVNSNESYKREFEKFPIAVDLIHIAIFTRHGKSEDYPVQCVSIGDGEISYMALSETARLPPFITLHRETYEEALCIFSEQQKGATSSSSLRH